MGETKGDDPRNRKWLLTINNPEEHGVTNELIERTLQDMGSFRYACYSHEVGLETKTHHIHIFAVFDNQVRFSTLKNRFPAARLDGCRGTVEQVRDYVFKTGAYANTEKEDTKIEGQQFEVGIAPIEFGQGKKRPIMQEMEELLDKGLTPSQILALSLSYRSHEAELRAHYMARRAKETPPFRDVRVTWHVGDPGVGKSHTVVGLMGQYPDNVYLMTDYAGGGLDLYQGERILFLDEYRGQLPFATLLNMLDGYKVQVHCRYANVYALWDEVHISSVLPPESVYTRMVLACDRSLDPVAQLMRRITEIVYHYKKDGSYGTYTVAGSQYKGYDKLRSDAGFDGFQKIGIRWQDIK